MPDEPVPDFSCLPALMRWRWVFVLIFLTPLSLVFGAVEAVLARCRSASPQLHDRRVANVQEAVRAARRAGRRVCTDRAGWQAMALRLNLYKRDLTRVPVRCMHDILHVDAVGLTVRCEPFVTVAQLTSRLLPLGLTLPCIPELDDLTVGGLLMGVGIESASHRRGLFVDCVLSYDIVTAAGDLIRVAPTGQHAELFRALPWSYGTLGVLVAAELRLIRVPTPYVRLSYIPCRTEADMVATLDRVCGDKRDPATGEDIEFVEALVYSATHSVVMTGTLATTVAKDEPVTHIGRWHAKWFFAHVRDKFAPGAVKEELIPLREYYHRHSRPIFWQMRELVPFGNHPIFRWLLGWVLPFKISLLKLTTPQSIGKVYAAKFVFQDMLVPMSQLSNCLTCFRQELGGLFPLWICPYLQRAEPEPQGFLRPTGRADEMFVDVGAYGMPPAAADPAFDVRATVRKLEAWVTAARGFQMLYADCYMDETEFRAMFDHTLYDSMRKAYGAESAFPTVYSKVKKEE